MPMIKRAKQYFAWYTDRFWLKVAYLMLATAVGILAISIIVDPDSYHLRRTTPVSDVEGDNSLTEDGGVISNPEPDGEGMGEGYGANEDSLSSDMIGGWNHQRDDGSADDLSPLASFGGGPFILPSEADFFEELKMDRDKTRSREQEVIRGLIDDPNTDPDLRKQAQEALLSLAERARREAEAESMIEAKGYDQAVVFLSESGASVVVKSGRLEEAEVQRIGDVVSVATGTELRHISIKERER